jgi:hypothetical protein
MNKNVIISLGIALSLTLSIWAVNHKQVVSPVQNGINVGSLASPYLNIGGALLYGAGEQLRTGTSTVCVLQSPQATSTLISGGINFLLASTSAVIVDISKAITVYATSTRIGTVYGVAGSAAAAIVASSTGSVAGDATIFAPNTYFMVKYADGNNGVANASKGSCYAVWAKI